MSVTNEDILRELRAMQLRMEIRIADLEASLAIQQNRIMPRLLREENSAESTPVDVLIDQLVHAGPEARKEHSRQVLAGARARQRRAGGAVR